MANKLSYGMSAACAGLFALLGGAAQAAGPHNDNWTGRTVIDGLPFGDTVNDAQTASNEPADPVLFCNNSEPPSRGADTLWYEYTTGATEEYVDVDAAGYNMVVAVFEGSPEEGYTMARGGCNNGYSGGQMFNSRIVGLRLKPHTRYAIETAAFMTSVHPTMRLDFRMTPAAVYRVTKTQDTNDGACDADCSLREAVAAANAIEGAIVVPAGRYVLAGQLETVLSGSIYGAGMNETVIDAAGTGRVIAHNTFDQGSYALHDLTLTGGVTADDGGAFLGGLGAGYYVFDRVALRDSQGANGGGASLTSVATNVSMFDSVVSGNFAKGDGGGLWIDGMNIELVNTSFVGNTAASDSGGDGGGIHLKSYYASWLKNTTVSDNQAKGAGGGVHFDIGSAWALIAANNSSIVDNATGGAASPQNGGLAFSGAPPRVPPALTNTVLAGNHAVQDPGALADCGKPTNVVLTTGYDFVQSPNGCVFSATGDKTAADPLLGPLTTDSVPVRIPLVGSPLIDAGDPGAGCEHSDERGISRPNDGDADGASRCDIGAIEWTPAYRGDFIFASGFE